ncbi:cyclic GMP-AMP synthase-like receptor [Episyrphus balteatus]|uniref:cyclic GMP-AMP synthase-like receptor n=1 Tax=Episyrphus balteatus TaxID=286459 RepID=UPI002486B217|nr:cyclic GMP-AMP synthase-like receptor [Episyrphus balteatus]XP_055837434.1 cyclic GMP-AMP synthase-like receptor [Episyrphus balteatus]
MDNVYHILSKEINIDKERQRYTKLYDIIRKTILDGLKRNDNFKTLFSNEKLCGSYADNLKVSKPNEFDIVIRLQFPAKDYVQIYPDNENKGNVFIDLTDVLTSFRRDIQKENNMYVFLSKLVDSQGLLLENKFQQWLQSLMTDVLTKINKTIIYGNEEYKLKYRREGPAHNIIVQNIKENQPLFSIDFVPGFVFPIEKSVSSRIPNSAFWEAIPRPLKGLHNGQLNNSSFRTSYTDSERLLISGKNQMKNALRLVKKYRDLRTNMKHLKSYYIKTLFLWMNEDYDKTFWNKPIFEIMLVVFQRLEECLLDGKIQFFWHDELNLLQTLKSTQIKEMHGEIIRAIKTLEKASRKDILDLFLSSEEQARVTHRELAVISDSVEEFREKNNKPFYCYITVYMLVISFQLFRALRQ